MLSSDIVQAVKRIQLVTGRQVADVMAGAYHSVFKGQGMEFEEVRPYVPGDDVRSIDWNVTARTGEPFVKRYQEERELTVMLVVDISASLDFGSGPRSKREAGAELSALLALSAIHNGDKIGLLLFHGDADEFIPPRKGQKHALRVVREVLARGKDGAVDAPRPRLPTRLWRHLRGFREARARDPRRSTNLALALEMCRRVLTRRAIVFVISDWIDDNWVTALRTAHRRHDVVSVLLTDPRERDMPPAGLVELQDAETGELRLVDTRSRAFQERVQKGFAARLETLKATLMSAGVDLVHVDASQPVVEPLLGFFRARQRRMRR